MPYKDPVKRKAYYERHQKLYQAKWFEKNRDKWNEYQASYKRELRKERMTYKEIHNMMVDFKISENECLVFKSSVIIMYGLQNNTVSKNKIKKATGYSWEDIFFIFHNLRANDIIKEYEWNLEDLENEETNWIELILCAMAGAGELVRINESEKRLHNDEKPIKWSDLYNLWKILYELYVRTENFTSTRVSKCFETKDHGFGALPPE
jgi:hypothetical protein